MSQTLLNISDIQHFSTGDGPGVRTTVFFKGCSLSCPWCHNPETQTTECVVLHYPSCTDTISGTKMTLEEVANEVLQDLDFYQRDGGVTLSGGECLLYPQQVLDLLKFLKERTAIHALVDTAGCVPYSVFQKINPFVDTYYVDLKTADSGQYNSIGGQLELISSNIQKLVQDGKDLHVRIPVIPDFNEDIHSMEQLAQCIAGTGAHYVDLLPFHRLGAGKYKALGRAYAYADTPSLPPSALTQYLPIFQKHNLEVAIEK